MLLPLGLDRLVVAPQTRYLQRRLARHQHVLHLLRQIREIGQHVHAGGVLAQASVQVGARLFQHLGRALQVLWVAGVCQP
ncbi:hypothetical protein D3C71_1681630 [compost metagenome]